MTLTNIGSNQTEISLANGDRLFFSYSTCVAARVSGKFYRTAQKWSATTSKHVSKWLDGRNAENKEQSFFDVLACQ